MKTILAAFKGETNTARLLLDNLNTPKINKIPIPNDNNLSFLTIKKYLQNNSILILMGQKPLVKDKIIIETQAKIDNKIIQADFPYEDLEKKFDKKL